MESFVLISRENKLLVVPLMERSVVGKCYLI
jgi:hypothetical protein